MIREALLNSERFLGLSDNTARVCFVACMLTADDRGNLEGGPGHLVRLWRDFGVDSTEKAAAIGQSLSDQDLIRFYESGDKRYVHIPRFGQRKRHLVHACPESQWCKDEQKQAAKQEKDRRTSGERQASVRRTTVEGKRSEEKRREVNPLGLFARFWELYPRKKSKGTAEKAFAKISPSEQLLQTILESVKRATTSDDWRKENGRFIPHPASWLNARGWEDELAPEGGLRLSL